MSEAVQYLIARSDLDMSPGKLAAQCAHASTACVLAHAGSRRNISNMEVLKQHQGAFRVWVESSFAKVVLKVKNKNQMQNLLQQLDEQEILYATIYDACRTELEPEEADGSTLTCIGVTPLLRSEVPDFIRKLQVYQ